MLLSLHFVAAQRIIVNSTGERIVMFPDGSWRFLEAGDSLLLRQSLPKSETLGLNDEGFDPSSKGTLAQQEDYMMRQWNELHFNIKALDKKIQNEFRAATNAQFSAAEIYHNAEANKKLLEPDRLAMVNENYEQSIVKLKIAKANQKNIKKLLEESKKLASVPFKKLKKKIEPLRSRFNLFLQEYKRNTPGKSSGEILPIAPIAKQPKSSRPDNRKEIEPKAVVVKSDNRRDPPALLANNVIKPYRSEPFRCVFKNDTLDATTGIHRVELEPGLLFTHTDPDLRPYFKNKELITCYGKLTKNNDRVYLTIDFQIASSHSQSNFGSLEKGSLLRLKLLSGEFVSLYNLRADRGRIDAYSGYTIFTGQYALGKKEIKELMSQELDKIRILWSTGYEDYDVYKVDFFVDRLTCLMSRSQ